MCTESLVINSYSLFISSLAPMVEKWQKKKIHSFRHSITRTVSSKILGKERVWQPSNSWWILACLTKLSNLPLRKHNTPVGVCDHHWSRRVTLHLGGCFVSPNIFIHTGKHHWYHRMAHITTNHMAVSLFPSFSAYQQNVPLSSGNAALLILVVVYSTLDLEESL